MARQGISRRNFMQQSAAWAAAFAARRGRPASGSARPQREKELNILCWEGYNSAQVLDPFREPNGATVKAESLTNDPTMINRLRAGETNVWDLINVNNPWARKIMLPERLIKPLDRARVRALLREDAAGVQAALQMGDGRQRRASCSAWRSASGPTASSSTPTRSAARPPRTRAGTCGTIRPTPANTASSNPTTGTSSTSAASPASIRSASTPTRRWRSSPRPPSASSRAPSWSATSPP